MKSPRLRRLLLILLGVILALFVVALIFPNIVKSPPIPQTANCQPAPIMNHVAELLRSIRLPCTEQNFMWSPNVGDEYNYTVRFNNFGLHAPDYSLQKPEGVFRIVIVGDSFPQGVQVPLEQGFPWLLAQALSRDTGKQIEIINLSVDAYGTDRELLLYTLLGWQFQPDLVLLSMYPGNDVQDNQIDLETRRYGYRLDRPFFTLADNGLILHNSPTFEAADDPDSAPYQWLTTMQRQQLPAPPEHLPEHPTVINSDPYSLEYPVELGLYLPEDAFWADAWALTEALTLQFRDVVGSSGVPFGVVVIPDRRAVHHDDWLATQEQYSPIHPELWEADPSEAGTRLEIFLSAHDIPALNLTNGFRAWAADHPDKRLYYQGDGHFNANGHAVAAALIAAWIRARLGV
jgi:lysophospholipase L1-like esterase